MKNTARFPSVRQMIVESALESLNEEQDDMLFTGDKDLGVEDGVDAVYHRITSDPEFTKQMNRTAHAIALEVARKAYAAKAYGEPERLDEPMTELGEMAVQRVLAIAKRIIGRPASEYEKYRMEPGAGYGKWLYGNESASTN